MKTKLLDKIRMKKKITPLTQILNCLSIFVDIVVKIKSSVDITEYMLVPAEWLSILLCLQTEK